MFVNQIYLKVGVYNSNINVCQLCQLCQVLEKSILYKNNNNNKLNL